MLFHGKPAVVIHRSPNRSAQICRSLGRAFEKKGVHKLTRHGRGMVASMSLAMARHWLMSRVMASRLVRPDLADKTLIFCPDHHHHRHNHHQTFKHRRFARTLSKHFLLKGCADALSCGDTSVTDSVGFSADCGFAISSLGDLI